MVLLYNNGDPEVDASRRKKKEFKFRGSCLRGNFKVVKISRLLVRSFALHYIV